MEDSILTKKTDIDTLVIATVLGGQAALLVEALRRESFRFTEVDSRGGFLQEPVTTLLIGLDRERIEKLLELARHYCKARLQYIPARLDASAMQGQPLMIEALTGGATLIAFEVEQFIQL